MRSARALLVVVLVLVLVLLVPAVAVAGSPTGTRMAEAKDHFDIAEKHYRVGEFQQAVAEYTEAYRLSERPGLLFNIAQAYRLAGNAERARYFYRSYLRSRPDAPNRADVEAFIEDLDRIIERQKREERERAAVEEQRRRAELAHLEATKPDRRGSRGLRIGGVATGAGGMLALGAGAFFYLSARSDWHDIDSLSDESGRWSPAFERKYDAARTKGTVSTVLFATGAGAVVAGGLMYYLGRDRLVPVDVALLPGTRGVAVMGRW